MGNINLFKALSSNTRVNILKTLINQEIHISELARELKISVPVTSRHVKILENAGLINKKIVGNVHLLKANIANLEGLLIPFTKKSTVEIDKNASVLDALKQIPGVEVHKVENNQYITSIDGEKGYFIYEVDGISPKIPINEYKPKNDVVIQLKKLVPIEKKKIEIRVKQNKKI